MGSPSAVEAIYMSRTIKVKLENNRPPGVPHSEVYGLVLKVIEQPGQPAQLFVETWSAGSCAQGMCDQNDVEVHALSESEVSKHLLGRRVWFPRSSGIGIPFPSDASDHGQIIGVECIGGRVSMVVAVDVNGTTTPFITPADLTQFNLLPKPAGEETG